MKCALVEHVLRPDNIRPSELIAVVIAKFFLKDKYCGNLYILKIAE